MANDIDRFMSKVERDVAGCWKWIGASLPRGYGRFYYKGKARYAHRVSLMMFGNVDVPDDKLVMHSCDNPNCVNPDHLSIGTQFDNMRDASKKGRTINPSDWKGTKNPKSKISDSQRLEIISKSIKGEKNRSIANEYGVTITRVQQIIKDSKISIGKTTPGQK